MGQVNRMVSEPSTELFQAKGNVPGVAGDLESYIIWGGGGRGKPTQILSHTP